MTLVVFVVNTNIQKNLDVESPNRHVEIFATQKANGQCANFQYFYRTKTPHKMERCRGIVEFFSRSNHTLFEPKRSSRNTIWSWVP